MIEILDLWDTCLNSNGWEQINATTIENKESDILIQIDFAVQFTIIFNSKDSGNIWLERIPRKLPLENQIELFNIFRKNYEKEKRADKAKYFISRESGLLMWLSSNGL